MSEFDSGSSNRKGFVRDVMRRISSSGSQGNDPSSSDQETDPPRSYQEDIVDLQDTIRLFGSDSVEFRRRLDRLLAEFEALRRRYQLTREQFTDAERQNERTMAL